MSNPSPQHSPRIPHIAPVPLDKAYRLLNHGPTVLVSAEHAGRHNVMAASWACALDFAPPKVTVVLDKATRTRELVEASGEFALQLPTLPMAAMTVDVLLIKTQRHAMQARNSVGTIFVHQLGGFGFQQPCAIVEVRDHELAHIGT